MSSIRYEILELKRFFRSRIFAMSMLAISMACIVYSLASLTNAVYIRDGEDVVLTFTTQKLADAILEEHGIITMAYDSVDFTGFDGGKVAEINITRAFEVTVTADGSKRSTMVTGGTVDQLLSTLGVSYDRQDILSHPPGMFLVEGDDVVLKRVSSALKTVEEAIPFEVEVRETSLIANGRSQVIQAGSDGRRVLTYEQTVVDGIVQDSELVSVDIAKQPVTQIVLKGTGSAVSDLNFGPLDANGKPVQYRNVLTNQIATGYSAGKGAWGASGMDLSYGYVAVNPNVIPYGTKLYIATPDNSFVYGYAIAADTGIGLMNGVIDVDLYYETYTESLLNGRRIVNIYILD